MPDIEVLGRYGGDFEAVATVGDFAYLCRNDTLVVLDVSDPAAVTPLGSVQLPDNGYDLVVSGSLAYVAAWDAGLAIVDVSDPNAPLLVGGYDTTGAARGVALDAGGRAYVAHYNGMEILNVSNPASPLRLGGTTGVTEAVEVVGSLAYLARGNSGLGIYDVSNPALPRGKGGLSSIGGYAEDLDVEGTLAYVAADYQGLIVIDVSDPAACVQLARHEKSAENVLARGSTVYFTNVYDGVEVLDTSVPSSPVWLAKFEPRTVMTPHGIFLSGDRLYVADAARQTLDIADVSNPASPLRLGGYEEVRQPGYATRIGPSHVYVYDQAVARWRILDVSKPDAPQQVGTSDIGGGGMITVVGSLGYMAAGDAGLKILDLSDPLAPKVIGSVAPGYVGSPIRVVGTRAYALSDFGFRIFDVSNPAAPAALGYGSSFRTNGGLAVAGTRLYLTNANLGLFVFDVSNPAAPVQIGQYDTQGFAQSVVVDGSIAYVADGHRGLLVLNVSDPANIVPIGSNSFSLDYDLTLDGPYLYGMKLDALMVYDLGNPTAPVRIGGHLIDGDRFSLAGDMAVASDSIYGLTLLRVARPDAMPPQVIRSCALPHSDRLRVRFWFDEDVSDSIAAADLTLMRVDDGAGATFTPQWFAPHVASGSATATFAASLPPGIYEARLNAAGVTDAWGNALAAPQMLRIVHVPAGQTFALPGDTVVHDISVVGRLDLGTSELIVDYDGAGGASPYSNVAALIAAGHNGGGWDGQGIVTSAPDAGGGLTALGVAEAAALLDFTAGDSSLWNGHTVDATAVLVRYTFAGDATLDGFISGDDYSAIDFASATPGASGWANGDFNYDGIISGDDYSIIDFNVVAQYGAGDAAGENSVAHRTGAALGLLRPMKADPWVGFDVPDGVKGDEEGFLA